MQTTLYYSSTLIASAVAAFIIAMIGIRRRAAPGAIALVVFMLAITWWAGTYAIHWISPAWPKPFFWLDATYVGVVTTPTVFLIFVFQFTGRGRLITWRSCLLLAIMPVLTLLLLWTDSYHGLFFAGRRASTAGAIFDGGPWFWTNVIYLYGLMLLGTILLAKAYLRTPRLQRGQVGTLLLGSLIPWIVNILCLAELNPLINLDLTPFAFLLTGVVLAYSLFRSHLLEIVPIARELLIEHLDSGMLVLDAENRVVDMNGAVRQILNVKKRVMLGQSGQVLMQRCPAIWESCQSIQPLRWTLIECGDSDQYIELRIEPLYRGNVFSGRLVVMHDVSTLMQAQIQVQQMNERLHAQLAENEKLHVMLRDQAVRDPLTNLYNRRYLEQTLEKTLERASQEGASVSLLALDIDAFKSLNDSRGHAAGDLVLQSLSRLILSRTRSEDVACRLGGDEFVVVLPTMSHSAALKLAEELRATLEQMDVQYRGAALHCTMSVGVSTYPIHERTVDGLLYMADQALYAAKKVGRNTVCGAGVA
jgi:diguanylate cyclase (GGDEF)-like protein